MDNTAHHQRQVFIGISLAVLATLIWSGNFIIARGVIKTIQPVTLAFYRWLTLLSSSLLLHGNIFLLK
jgi:drug/metabolite transporter (DMT)-like permease